MLGVQISMEVEPERLPGLRLRDDEHRRSRQVLERTPEGPDVAVPLQRLAQYLL